ncbi:MAG: sulfite exporter TauE/SafE family protein [Desulfobacteraceae bacterium]|nr:sulfite exporter TauE/SafE family protein [Desulfobacteraceae bacterium]
MIVFSMFLLGLMVGFVGAGGAGLVIAVLTVGFGVPIHTALGTSLGAMMFTTMSGVVSHFREHNVALKEGLLVGTFGAFGAYGGVHIASILPSGDLSRMTAGMLFLSAVLITLRMFFSFRGLLAVKDSNRVTFWLVTCALGLLCGVLSGTFGIGAAPFIQIGLLLFFSLSLPQVAGTTMLVILPIAFTGGFGYLAEGHLDIMLFLQVVAGLMSGAYIGAKFTRRLHLSVLKTTMVAMPVFAGTLLWLGS